MQGRDISAVNHVLEPLKTNSWPSKISWPILFFSFVISVQSPVGEENQTLQRGIKKILNYRCHSLGLNSVTCMLYGVDGRVA